MKLMKQILGIVVCITIVAFLFSCKKSGFSCDCNTGSQRQLYSIGTNSLSGASGKCSTLRQQYGWDSCSTVEAK